ncbi:B12-binding domain-containing radical SAM protein [Candidatus Magnetomonas plexicatena]|uniref:B12-binding domain-containing radical SAM protein n=1 Tax=Candidatus Magnetomonas plexicatena TaxID=2552947 RepID=UPI001C7771BC|nr:B12-binding domain-containing radical SAM protein [Nitrospirales bacterium LBB_01]
MSLDILFVSPSLNWQTDLETKISMRVDPDIPNQETPNVGIGYLLSSAKKYGIKAEFVDMIAGGVSVESLVEMVKKKSPKVVGFTAFTEKVKMAAHLAKAVKDSNRNILTCVGGPHAIAIPKETLEEFDSFDFAISGEGESLLPKIAAANTLDDLRNIKGIVTRESTITEPLYDENIETLPFPDWDSFDLSKYLGTFPHRTKLELPIITSRGCPFQCVFCCKALGSAQRRRSVASVMSEIKYNIEHYGCESIAFLDETFILQSGWANEFFSEMKKTGINKKVSWSCSIRVSNASFSLLSQMKEAGCYYIFFGIESADDNILKIMKKGITVRQIKDAVENAKKAGIIPVGPFIIGMPGDTVETTYKAIELGKELDLYSITFPIATPFPKTELREMALRNEYGMRILSNDWALYGKQITPVLESDDFSAQKRLDMQKTAYDHFPKKRMDDYLKHLRDAGYPF